MAGITKYPIISVTGTKGKTTIVYLIDTLLRSLGKNTLRVDTKGHYVNGQQKSTLDDSKSIWGLVPTVCPGKFLFELFSGSLKNVDDGVAVLECSLGSSNSPGLGYFYHNVGVFSNVFEDHLGSSSRLRTQEDIASAKSFIFNRLSGRHGFAVFNADDKLVTKVLSTSRNRNNEFVDFSDQVAVPCGVEFSEYDIKRHMREGGEAFTVRDNKLLLISKNKSVEICNFENIPWTFGGSYMPSVLNIMYAVAAVYSFFGGELPAGFTEKVEQLRLDRYDGRVTVLKAKNGAMVIADYAHEKVSLAAIGSLAKDMAEKRGGKAIGVVRMAHDRTDEMIKETGRVVGEVFDKIVVFDKIDGYWRVPREGKNKMFKQAVGRVSEVLSGAVAEVNPDVIRILREDEALTKAAELAGSNDVVVSIVNDDVVRSVDWIREKFDAEFV